MISGRVTQEQLVKTVRPRLHLYEFTVMTVGLLGRFAERDYTQRELGSDTRKLIEQDRAILTLLILLDHWVLLRPNLSTSR
jgi:hypothetical protein